HFLFSGVMSSSLPASKEIMSSITVELLSALTFQDHGRKLQDRRNLIGVVRSGAKGISVRFSLLYVEQGKTRRFYIGVWPGISFNDICAEAQRARRLVRDGIN